MLQRRTVVSGHQANQNSDAQTLHYKSFKTSGFTRYLQKYRLYSVISLALFALLFIIKAPVLFQCTCQQQQGEPYVALVRADQGPARVQQAQTAYVPEIRCLDGPKINRTHCRVDRSDEISYCKALDAIRQVTHPLDLKKTRTLYIMPLFGLANRLRALASGTMLAKEFNANLVVLWHDDTAICKGRWQDLFSSPLIPVGCLPGQTTMPEHSSCRVHLIKDVEEARSLHDKWEIVDGKEVLCISGYDYQTKPYTLEMREWYEELVPIPSIKESVEQFMAEHNWYGNPGLWLGVHMRTTDNPRTNKTSVDVYTELASRICEISQMTLTKLRAIVASDTLQNERMLASKLHTLPCFVNQPDSVIMFPKPIRDADTEGTVEITESRTTLAGTQEAVADMYLLSKTRFLIGAGGSTFSRAAWYWGNNAYVDALPNVDKPAL